MQLLKNYLAKEAWKQDWKDTLNHIRMYAVPIMMVAGFLTSGCQQNNEKPRIEVYECFQGKINVDGEKHQVILYQREAVVPERKFFQEEYRVDLGQVIETFDKDRDRPFKTLFDSNSDKIPELVTEAYIWEGGAFTGGTTSEEREFYKKALKKIKPQKHCRRVRKGSLGWPRNMNMFTVPLEYGGR